MGVCAEGGEDTRDVSRLEGIGYLHAEEPETEVKELRKRAVG